MRQAQEYTRKSAPRMPPGLRRVARTWRRQHQPAERAAASSRASCLFWLRTSSVIVRRRRAAQEQVARRAGRGEGRARRAGGLSARPLEAAEAREAGREEEARSVVIALNRHAADQLAPLNVNFRSPRRGHPHHQTPICYHTTKPTATPPNRGQERLDGERLRVGRAARRSGRHGPTRRTCSRSGSCGGSPASVHQAMTCLWKAERDELIHSSRGHVLY